MKYCYNEYNPDPNADTVVCKTREEILLEYYPYWSERMKKNGKADMISEDLCIDDWIVVNWAWEE